MSLSDSDTIGTGADMGKDADDNYQPYHAGRKRCIGI